MRVLLDECIPRSLRQELPGHEVKTVAETGWAGVKNGELLRLASKKFEVSLTIDRNLETPDPGYAQAHSLLSFATTLGIPYGVGAAECARPRVGRRA